jgi:hypothetical protein
VTRVVFGCPNPAAGGCDGPAEFNLGTPALDGFTDTELDPIDIPAGCFDEGTLQCNFQIGADVENAVTESDETNNNAAGACGPQIF